MEDAWHGLPGPIASRPCILSGNQFKKSDRLLKRFEFVELSNSRKAFQDRFFIVAFKPGAGKCARLGITASKRVGNAVTRNRVKRLVREVFRLKRDRITAAMDINVIAKKTAADISFAQAGASLENLFVRLGGNSN
jgi:ribonuclease P protein component